MPFQYLYLDYLDAATGKTLVVTPGSAYTVKLAPGRNSAMPSFPGDGRWSNANTFLNMSVGVTAPDPAPISDPAPETPAPETSAAKDKGGA